MDTFWKVQVEVRNGVSPEQAGKMGHPQNKLPSRQATSGAAQAGFLATAQAALAGSADLQQGTRAWYITEA